MAVAYYRSLDDAEAIEVEFLTLADSVRVLKLLVDSGFTGKSSLILGNEAREPVRAEVPPAQALGALQGAQNRGWVTCRIPDLGFQCTVIGIITDISSLSLPSGVQGMAGLTFLRNFAHGARSAKRTDGTSFLARTDRPGHPNDCRGRGGPAPLISWARRGKTAKPAKRRAKVKR
jgi:hypothetical protein